MSVELPAVSCIVEIDQVNAAPQPPLSPSFLHVDLYKFLPNTEVYSTPITVSQSRALAETGINTAYTVTPPNHPPGTIDDFKNFTVQQAVDQQAINLSYDSVITIS